LFNQEQQSQEWITEKSSPTKKKNKKRCDVGPTHPCIVGLDSSLDLTRHHHTTSRPSRSTPPQPPESTKPLCFHSGTGGSGSIIPPHASIIVPSAHLDAIVAATFRGPLHNATRINQSRTVDRTVRGQQSLHGSQTKSTGSGYVPCIGLRNLQNAR
jgi:hypothetical protein